jgi:preprotein translocase subunit SecE
MATKTSVMSDERPLKKQGPSGVGGGFGGGITGAWGNSWGKFTEFLNDVRAEMRKVVTPNRKEVESTTTVVIISVFLYGLFFWVVDAVFSRVVEQILHRMGAQ